MKRAHRSAIARSGLSRPIQLAIAQGVIRKDDHIFDYGCGRGGDLTHLSELGYTCHGWDPISAPSAERKTSDIVNCGYVINVIRCPRERAEAAQEAWSLAREALVISARPLEELATTKVIERSGDGFTTSIGTFQKFFSQEELKTWVSRTLSVQPLPLAPGIFVAFRSNERRAAFLAERARRRLLKTTEHARALLDEYGDVFHPVIDFIDLHGRAPRDEELANSDAVRQKFGSCAQASKLVARALGEDRWRDLAEARKEDILVFLALSQFDGRPKLSELPIRSRYDISAFFGRYKSACARADELLSRLGLEGLINLKCASSPLGKLTPNALYVHTDYIDELSLELRLYEGCARAYLGAVNGATLVKLHRHEPKVSYLAYPNFDRVAHPALAYSYSIHLQTFRINFRHYAERNNRPILHRKETFLPEDDQRHQRFSRLTRAEERHGLLDDTQRIGYESHWQQILDAQGLQIRGHKIAPK